MQVSGVAGAAPGNLAMPGTIPSWLAPQVNERLQRLQSFSLHLGHANHEQALDPECELQLSQHLSSLDLALDGLGRVLAQYTFLEPSGVQQHMEPPHDPANQPPAQQPSWAGLPHELLATILHPQSVGQQARCVCKRFRGAYDAGVQRATLHLLAPAVLGRALPPAPRCAHTVRVDASELGANSYAIKAIGGIRSLAGALEVWAVAAPLELDILVGEDSGDERSDAEAVAGMLRCPTFAPGGLQALHINEYCNSSFWEQGMALVAASLPAAPQLSALRALALSGWCGEHITALCAALQASTHMRSLTMLDLGICWDNAAGGVALAECLRASPHLSSSLQQLVLCDNSVCDEGAAALADAVASCGIRLSHLNLRNCELGNGGVAAWAAALSASPHLAGLEVLDLSYNHLDIQGMAVLCSALQSATHLVRLQQLRVQDADLMPEAAMRFVQLLRCAPHLASSIRQLIWPRFTMRPDAATAGEATDAVAAMIGMPLPQLRVLDVSGYRGQQLQRLCAALPGASHLTGLHELRIQPAYKPQLDQPCPADCGAVDAALAAATQLSGLRALPGRYTPVRMSRLLHDAPHLRGLTALKIACEPDDNLAALQDVLVALPRLRSLEVLLNRCGALEVQQLAAALQHAACTPSLEELCLRMLTQSNDSVAYALALLQRCTCLCNLRRIALTWPGDDDVSSTWLGVMLAATPHLASLRELRLQVGWEEGSDQGLYDALAGSPLSHVNVVFDRC